MCTWNYYSWVWYVFFSNFKKTSWRIQARTWPVFPRWSCLQCLSGKRKSKIHHSDADACIYIYIHMGMDQYLLIPFLGGWTSIYQLFWCSPGVQGFDPSPYIYIYTYIYKWNDTTGFISHCSSYLDIASPDGNAQPIFRFRSTHPM